MRIKIFNIPAIKFKLQLRKFSFLQITKKFITDINNNQM